MRSIRSPLAPMEAVSVDELPQGANWVYEQKGDGFRCLVFRNGASISLQSKSGKPLDRYFPEIVAAVRALSANNFVMDGELAVPVKAHSLLTSSSPHSFGNAVIRSLLLTPR